MALIPRVLNKGGTHHEGVRPFGGLIAGCGQAVSEARLYLLTPAKNYLEATKGSGAKVVRESPGSIATLVFELQRKGCVISSKTKVLASSKKLGIE
eukprot:16447196-Heterocapsa_arctica.AAC.1